MTRKLSYAKALDRALAPIGFTRRGDEWIRVRGDLQDSVYRQSSWLGGVTVVLFQKDLETEKLYLEIFGPRGAIQMPGVSAGIGGLIDGRSRWWTKDEPDGPDQMVAAVLEFGLPWFDRVRSLAQQADNWYGRRVEMQDRGYFGPGLIGLGLTLYRMGEVEEARAVLRKPVPKTAIPTSVQDVAMVREWLERRVAVQARGGV